MIWLTWRQHRAQLVVGAAALAAILVFLLPTGFGIASTFRGTGLAACLGHPGRDCSGLSDAFTGRYGALSFTIPLFLVVPAMLGVFWGAPLVARELEQGTHRLAWTQGIGRSRWAGTKIVALVAATAAFSGVLAWVVSWWSRPLVAASDDRFALGIFDLRGVVPVAYAVFALAVGVAAGTLIRRTIPAMAATLGVYGVVRIAVEIWARPHFETPKVGSASFFGVSPRSGLGDWVLSTRTVDRAGHLLGQGQVLDFNVLNRRCPTLPPPGTFPDKHAVDACVRSIGLHVQTTYQPGSRFWAFQGIESALFAALAVGLLAFSIWWVRRRIA